MQTASGCGKHHLLAGFLLFVAITVLSLLAEKYYLNAAVHHQSTVSASTEKFSQGSRESSENVTHWQWQSAAPTSQGTQIPKILHQTYSTEMVPREYQPFINACLTLNPDWQYFLWRDVDIEAFIVDHFPKFMIKFQRFRSNLERADVIRYMVLYHYGGIYLDMDVQCVRPFFPDLASVGPAFLDQERREQAQILYGREFTAMNSAMGAVPRHPFFLAMLSAVSSVPSHVKDILWRTGPHLLTKVYSKWIQAANQSSDPAILLNPEVFSPIVDTRSHNFARLCRHANADFAGIAAQSQKWLLKGCRVMRSKGWKPDATNRSTTIGIHRFLHMGYSWGPRAAGKVNISAARPTLRMYTVHNMQFKKDIDD